MTSLNPSAVAVICLLPRWWNSVPGLSNDSFYPIFSLELQSRRGRLQGAAIEWYNADTPMSATNATNFRQLNRFRSSLTGVLLALCSLMPYRIAAGPQQSAPLTQRRINEYAASLQRARLALIEDTGLRRPQEPLTAYFARIVAACPGETAQTYAARIRGYVAALLMAAKETTPLRAMPALGDNDAANREQWLRTVKALRLLPLSIGQARATWQRLQKQTPPVNRQDRPSSNLAIDSVAGRRLGAELTQATELILVAYNALRDARP